MKKWRFTTRNVLMHRQKDVKMERELQVSREFFCKSSFHPRGAASLSSLSENKDCVFAAIIELQRRRVKWIFNGFCASSNKLLSILNLLCNSTQNSSTVVRDACYGCFFRVGVLTPGATLLNQLSQCANIYLSNTSYAGCANQLSVSAISIIQLARVQK